MAHTDPPMMTQRPRVYYGWIIVGLCFWFLALAYGIWYSFSVFFVALLQEFGWQRAETAGAFSVFVVIHGVVGIVAGGLTDRLGPKAVIAIGGIILAGALASSSLIAAPWHLYLTYGIGCAIGVGSIGWIPCVTLIQRWFRRHLGLALGLASSGIGLGILATAPVLQALINAIGWRGAFVTLGAVMLVVPPLAVLFLRGRPEEVGQQPDGTRGPAIAQRQDDERIVDRAWVSRPWTVKAALRTWRFWLMMLSFGAASFTTSTVFVHQVALLTDAGYEALLAASVVGLMGLVSVGGKIGWGVLADRWGREIVFALGVSAMLIGLALLAMAHRIVVPWYAVLYGVIFALGYSVTAVITPTATADVFSGRHFGAIYGTLQFGTGLCSAAGAWLAGLIFDLTRSYHPALAVAAIVCTLAIVGVYIAAPRKVRVVPGRVPTTPSKRTWPLAKHEPADRPGAPRSPAG